MAVVQNSITRGVWKVGDISNQHMRRIAIGSENLMVYNLETLRSGINAIPYPKTYIDVWYIHICGLRLNHPSPSLTSSWAISLNRYLHILHGLDWPNVHCWCVSPGHVLLAELDQGCNILCYQEKAAIWRHYSGPGLCCDSLPPHVHNLKGDPFCLSYTYLSAKSICNTNAIQHRFCNCICRGHTPCSAFISPLWAVPAIDTQVFFNLAIWS